MKRSRSRSGITLRDRDRQSSLTIHVCFLHETQFVRTNDANMEEAGILEKITRSGFCYPALNQVGDFQRLPCQTRRPRRLARNRLSRPLEAWRGFRAPAIGLFRTGARAEVSSREGHARRDLSPRVCPDPVETFRCKQNNEAQCIWYYRLAQLIVLQRHVRQLSMAQVIIIQEFKSFLRISIRTWLMDQNPCETSHFLAIGILTQRCSNRICRASFIDWDFAPPGA